MIDADLASRHVEVQSVHNCVKLTVFLGEQNWYEQTSYQGDFGATDFVGGGF